MPTVRLQHRWRTRHSRLQAFRNCTDRDKTAAWTSRRKSWSTPWSGWWPGCWNGPAWREPPVDALRIAEEHLGIPVTIAAPAEDERRPRGSSGIVISPHATDEQRQGVAAHGIARALLPDLLRKFGVEPGTENKQAAAFVRGLLVGRLLVPTKLLRSALRTCKYDLESLKGVFRTAQMETIAHRLLDLDDPCMIAIVDDGVVSSRRGNASAVSKKLTTAEQSLPGAGDESGVAGPAAAGRLDGCRGGRCRGGLFGGCFSGPCRTIYNEDERNRPGGCLHAAAGRFFRGFTIHLPTGMIPCCGSP